MRPRCLDLASGPCQGRSLQPNCCLLHCWPRLLLRFLPSANNRHHALPVANPSNVSRFPCCMQPSTPPPLPLLSLSTSLTREPRQHVPLVTNAIRPRHTGMILAVFGMALYGYFNSLAPAPKAPPQPVAGADKRNSSAGGLSGGGAAGAVGGGLTEPLLGVPGAAGVGSSSAGDAVTVAVHSRYHTGAAPGEGR